MSIWADYSKARPSPVTLKQAGIVGLFRYLAPLPNSKVIDVAERDTLLGAGFDLVLNWEWYEGRCNEGASAGKDDATEAVRQSRALDYPDGCCIYFSHDTGVYDWQAIEAYFTAAGKVVHAAGYTIGAYGSFALLQFLFSKGLIDYGWQTRAWSTYTDPASGLKAIKWHPRAVIRQTGAALVPETDNDIVLSDDIGSWLGSDMNLSDTDKQWLAGQFQHILDDLNGTKLRIAEMDPIVKDLDTRTATLQAAVAALPGGSTDAKAVVDEMGRRLNSA